MNLLSCLPFGYKFWSFALFLEDDQGYFLTVISWFHVSYFIIWCTLGLIIWNPSRGLENVLSSYLYSWRFLLCVVLLFSGDFFNSNIIFVCLCAFSFIQMVAWYLTFVCRQLQFRGHFSFILQLQVVALYFWCFILSFGYYSFFYLLCFGYIVSFWR